MTISSTGAKGISALPPNPNPPLNPADRRPSQSNLNKISLQSTFISKGTESAKRVVSIEENSRGENTQVIPAQKNAVAPTQSAKQIGLLLDYVV